MLYNFGLCAIKGILDWSPFVDESTGSVPRDGWTIDTRRFCERKESLSAALGPEDLPRLDAEAIEDFIPVAVSVGVVASPRGLSGLCVDLDGAVMLTCQRCMQPVEVGIRRRALFELVDSSSALDADDDDDWDRMLHSDRFDLIHLVEDEMLLALPYSPRHDQCEPVERTGAGEKVLPFAGLAVLRNSGRR